MFNKSEEIKTLRDAGNLYWKSEHGVLYNDDAISAMRKHIKDESVDLIITSPPYNLGNNHHTGGKKTGCYFDNMPEQEYQNWQVDFLNECFRVLKPTGSLFYNHKNRIKKGMEISPVDWISRSQFISKQTITWVNGSQNFDNRRFYPFTENVYWLSKDHRTRCFNTLKLPNIIYRNRWKPQRTKGLHTRQFPIQMPYDFIRCFPNAEVILDPFGGSGTVALASEILHKKWILIEKETDFYICASNLILMRRWGCKHKKFNTIEY